MNYENKILDAIETIVDNAVNKAGYDRTIQAKIINCDDPTIGKYKVQYQDSIFYAYANNSEINYTPNSEVYVLIPNNDMSRDKSILGSVSKLGKNYVSTAEGEEAFELIGNNCVEDSKEYSLCSYKTTTNYEIYNRNSSSANNLRLNVKNIEEYIKSSTSILLAATIKINIPIEQQFRGNYGILYEMVFKDNATEQLVTKNYVLDVNHFEGNPYSMPNFKRQVGIFDIDGVNFQYINKIKLFCYDFPNQDNTKPDDIFIKEFEIYGSQALSAEELETYSLSFITPQGIYFDNNDLASATRTLMAQVKVKGKNINSDSQKLPYYWFVENNGVTSLSEDFNAYGGQGWKCLNQKNIVKNASAGVAPVVEWVPADYKYIIKKSDSAAKETKYKCVVIYNNIQLSKTITITNYSSNYEITIESDSGEQFYYDIGNPTLTCKINGQELSSNAYTYQWAEIDNNNNFYVLAETTQDNTIYNNAVAGYMQLKADIAAERAMAAASQTQLNQYLTTINSYDTIMRVEGRKIYHLQVNTITHFSIYKCSVYYNGVYIGTASITINNSLDRKDMYSLVINNGSQTFKYSETGISPASKSLDNPQVILPLSFTIYDNLGNPIDDTIASQCQIKWNIPNENTMIKIPNTYDIIEQNNYQTIINTMSINYNIEDRYDISKNNNTIQLIINYKGMNLVAETDLTFVKEGEPGTNGTDFICKIVPNTQSTNFGYPMILNGNINYTPRQTGRWFNVQLWHNGNKIFEGSTSGNSTENKNVNIKWSILKNKYTSSIYDNTSLSVTENGVFTYSSYQGSNSPANIVKVILTYDNIEYYTTIPVITATTSSGYGISLIENTGFRYAMYSADGRRPQYDNSNPFTLKVTRVINNVTEDISTLTQSNAVSYTWYIRGAIYNPVNSTWVSKQFLKEYSITGITLQKNQKMYKPIDDFDGECVTNGLECVIKNTNNTEVGRIHIPIHLLLNKYGHAAINGWDGNSVSIDKNGNGVILAPQIGAGQKEADNSFTGMLMGSVKEAGKNTTDVGMFGYNFGERSLFLNAKDGSAIFGKKGPGQIILDPAAQKAMLYSNGYWKNYKDDGKPTNYTASNKNNSGMLIDLTTPLIEWGNGNFKVDVNGHITAKGGGTIAGFNIDDDSIYTGTKSSNSNVRLSSVNGKFARTINGVERNNLHFAINNNFAVDSNGAMYSSSGNIGGWTIGTNAITATYSNYRVGLFNASNENLDFLVVRVGTGTQADPYSYPFFVRGDGTFHATKATISGTLTAGAGSKIGPWNVTADAIYNGKSSLTQDAEGVYIGTDGISLGKKSTFKVTKNGAVTASNIAITGGSLTIGSSFSVTNEGVLTASSGKISGWTINSSELTSSNGNTHIGSTGALSGPNWSIDANGNATFSNIKITKTGYSSSRGNLIDYGDNFYIESNGILHAKGGEFQGKITASSGKIGGWTIESSQLSGSGKISGGTISGSTISGGSISIGNRFSVNSNGVFEAYTSGSGYIKMGVDTDHPSVSGLNVYGGINMHGTGMSWCDGIGNAYGDLNISSAGKISISPNTETWIGNTLNGILVRNSSGNMVSLSTLIVQKQGNGAQLGNIWIGDNVLNGNGGAQIAIGRSITLYGSSSGAVYAGGVSNSDKVVTVGGSPSSLKIKRNVKEKDMTHILDIISQIKLYEYDYIPEIENGKHDYGYIIDYLEKIPNIDQYFTFEESEYNRSGITSKRLNIEHLIKFLLGAIIELNKKIK